MTVSQPSALRARVDPDASDDDLVLATRAGDSSAYGVLWDRHSPAALRAARAITSSIDPEDLVSEAFAKTFSAIRNGGGPTDAFRPYLFAAVRSAAATWGGKQKDIALDYIEELPDDDSEDSLDLLSDKTLLTLAFQELPERWRTLLWYLEVEGMKPREIAPLMGMTPNAVSVLASRARDGFKTAWLHAHIKEPGREPECRWTCERIVAQGRKKHIARADRARFETHLEQCRRCTLASTEVAHASSKLRAVLLPAILGGPAAAAYSAASPAPAMAAVAAGAMPRRATPWVIAGGAVVAATVVVAVVAVAAQLPPAGTPSADGEPSSALIVESPAPIAAPAPDAPPVAPAPPVTVPETQPLPEPEFTPESEQSSDPGVAPVRPSETTPPTAIVEPRTNPQARPPAAPVEEPPVDAAPTIVWDIPASSTVPPSITGTGTAGGQIDILDEDGRIVASTVVDADGTFSVRPDADSLHQGISLTLRHTSPLTGEQTLSEPIGPVTFDTPTLDDASDGVVRRTDADGDGADDDIELVLQGAAGTTVALIIDGRTATNWLLTDAPTVAAILDVPLGAQRVELRYVDAITGDVGLMESEHIVVIP